MCYVLFKKNSQFLGRSEKPLDEIGIRLPRASLHEEDDVEMEAEGRRKVLQELTPAAGSKQPCRTGEGLIRRTTAGHGRALSELGF